MSDHKQLNICIVAHFAFGALKGGNNGHVGGVERQTALLASWLSNKGHKVTVLTWDEGQDKVSIVDGIRVIKMCRQNSGVPGLRFFYPRWTSLNSALILADADIYYQNCAEYVTGQVALWCKFNKKHFVYSVASDPDCDGKLEKFKTFREKSLYRYGLLNADSVIVQTDVQKKMLLDGFSVDSIVLPMPCPGPSVEEYEAAPLPSEGEPFRIVWVGRISTVKRLELLLDIAESQSNVIFEVAGKPDYATEYSNAILDRAKCLKNVTLHGMVSRDGMHKLYKHAHALCCTSRYEGFPNTFIEAWSYGLPVISTVNPDGLITDEKLGYVGTDCGQLSSAILSLISDKENWSVMSQHCRQFYLKRHTVNPVMSMFEELFISVVEGK